MSRYKCPRYKRGVRIVATVDRAHYSGILLYDNQVKLTDVEIQGELRDSTFTDWLMHQEYATYVTSFERFIARRGLNIKMVGSPPLLDNIYGLHDWYVENGPITEQLHKLFKGRSKAFEFVGALAPKPGGARHEVALDWVMAVLPDDADFGLAKLGVKWK
ncbi:hypothetical protein V6R86_13125 [Sphingomonas kaistensis]|uniref:Uncharacterized protein n=1 Tax=Sphingomonas kaistensis TaxID=298708 RepID=A0ABZ2G5V5_9SPHN